MWLGQLVLLISLVSGVSEDSAEDPASVFRRLAAYGNAELARMREEDKRREETKKRRLEVLNKDFLASLTGTDNF